MSSPEVRAWRERWRAMEEFERTRPIEEVPLEEALEWIESVQRFAAPGGPPLVPTVEEKVARLARISKALAKLR